MDRGAGCGVVCAEAEMVEGELAVCKVTTRGAEEGGGGSDLQDNSKQPRRRLQRITPPL